jgi:hypothetical protein
MRIENDILKQGYWWLLEEPENKLFGTLRIQTDGGVALEVNGLFRSPYGEIGSNSVFEYERILGETEDGKPVVLLNCFESSSSLRIGGGISQTSITSKFAFIGITSKSVETLEFTKVTFSFEGLGEWLNVSGLSVNHNIEEKKGEIRYEIPESISYVLENDVKVSFDFRLNFSSLTQYLAEAKVTQKEFITLEFPSPLQIFDIIKTISRVIKFFCFAVDRTVSIKSVSVAYRDDEEKHYAEVYYRSLPHSEKPTKIDTYLMLFYFSMISKDFGKLLSNWLKYFDFLEPTFNLYFYTIQNTTNLESRFLFLAQALETFHRRTCNEHLFNEQDYSMLAKTLRKNVEQENKEFQDWVESKLKYGNELTLRKRLKKLIEPFKDLFGSKGDRNKFIGQFIDTRNYLTHYDEGLKESTCKGEDLLNLGRKAEALLQLHLLKSIEFPENLFAEVFNRGISSKIRYSKRLL